MILLDIDHVSLLKYRSSERGLRLRQRLDGLLAGEIIGVSVITVEEQMRGWLATIARERSVRRQVPAYDELASLFGFFAQFEIAPFDDLAALQFEELRAAKVKVGSMDLKIAAIALVPQSLLLSANRRHFDLVPGLRVENWLD